jgi:hypothetical protein
MRAAALLVGGITQRAWSDLLYSVETGEPAFGRVFGQDQVLGGAPGGCRQL